MGIKRVKRDENFNQVLNEGKNLARQYQSYQPQRRVPLARQDDVFGLGGGDDVITYVIIGVLLLIALIVAIPVVGLLIGSLNPLQIIRTTTTDSRTVIAVIHGAEKNNWKDVELYEPGRQTTCKDIADHPYDAGAAGLFINNKLITCGGEINLPMLVSKSDCHIYNKATNTWDRFTTIPGSMGNLDSAMIPWNKKQPNIAWLTGGAKYNTPGDAASIESTDKTWLVNVDTRMVMMGPNLPAKLSVHNLIRIDDDRVMLLGGDTDTNKAWMFSYAAYTANMANGWTPLRDLMEARSDAAAGLFIRNGKKYVLIAGGENRKTSEIYDIDANSWSVGPMLPVMTELQDAKSLQGTDTFWIFGGADKTNSPRRDVLRYDVASNSFVRENQMLNLGRRWGLPIGVPSSYLNC